MVVTTRKEDVVLQRILVMKEKVTVMVLEMEVAMMDIKAVKGILSVAAIIAGNLGFTFMKKMIVVKSLQAIYKHLKVKNMYLEHRLNQKKVRQTNSYTK